MKSKVSSHLLLIVSKYSCFLAQKIHFLQFKQREKEVLKVWGYLCFILERECIICKGNNLFQEKSKNNWEVSSLSQRNKQHFVFSISF